ncbi:hypothetical protein BDY17DRAFT_245803 [Neohortaea acidophila]|uniref:C2H2-type domain-containing protein n=1 Tax=Neohortaea acidophila TaxID=245834 RepID=A0A6A6Q3H4_9PEZI|nr:uncharacterized protein BDY17DRAFT_245803 [Neohortaea acidophila]KAF2486564.1 hypothetical protein BDY17DRAFT_245803 [Neohortaea acidophila]
MDPNSTPQTVAQAVQAATQQAQQAQQGLQQHAPSSTIDNLTCQWQGCGERCDSAESLYDHVCERHVGRKSTNNLNLTCAWGACRTTTVKRDHITSHIRVHVPLKPHKCDFCGKAFKRPQDLKKHVKTHADDPGLMNSPTQNNSGRGSLAGALGVGQPNGKTSGYYAAGHDNSMANPYSTYQSALGANAHNPGHFHQHTAPAQYAGYGSVSYPTTTSSHDIQSLDTRRRAIEALNDFLGDIKRRAIDPQSYYDVGQRLQANALPLPVGNGYNTGYNNTSYNNYSNVTSLLESFNNNNNNHTTTHMGGHGGDMHAGVATQNYSLPLPNARTKNDLQDIDRFLEELQTTVYENSSAAAAAGVVQPGVHAMHTAGGYGFNNNQQNHYRSSQSPPNYRNDGDSGLNAMSGVSMSNANSIDTPVLTPASMSSYSSSGHSPSSAQSRMSLGSNQMYPSLPSVTGISDLGSGYPITTSAPPSSLSSGFEDLGGRRYSGGRLQRQAPTQTQDRPDVDMEDAEDGSRTPKASDVKQSPKSGKVNSIDPALRGEDVASPAESVSTPIDDKRQEEWVENIRVIEMLKKWVSDRLKNGEYEDEEKTAAALKHAVDEDDDMSVKIAKLVEEKMADAEGEVQYPTLPPA